MYIISRFKRYAVAQEGSARDAWTSELSDSFCADVHRHSSLLPESYMLHNFWYLFVMQLFGLQYRALARTTPIWFLSDLGLVQQSCSLLIVASKPAAIV